MAYTSIALTPLWPPPIFAFRPLAGEIGKLERFSPPFRTGKIVTTAKVGFGEHLRREREMRGITLDEICSATRIATRFLQAMENEQWEVLPGGVFNRGFVRAVAHHLGLDEESLIAEYTLATGDKGVTSSSVASDSGMPETAGRWLSLILIVVVMGAIAVGGWYGWRRYVAHRNASRATSMLDRLEWRVSPRV